MSYQPRFLPDDPKQLPALLRQELHEIQKAMLGSNPSLELEVLHKPPARFRPGMLVLADGVDWNPGSGEGLYRRDVSNASWVFIG